MHHGLLLKVKGTDEKDAQANAHSIMQQTIRCETCERSVNKVNWDCFDCKGIVDNAWIAKHRADLAGIETVENLVTHYLNQRKANLRFIEKRVNVELKRFTAAMKKTKKMPRPSMFTYYLRELEALQNVIEFEDADKGLYTLHCVENHYADMTEYTKGDKDYYFWYDRHF